MPAPKKRKPLGGHIAQISTFFGPGARLKRVPALPATSRRCCGLFAGRGKPWHKVATISRRVAAIRYAHKLAGLEPPTNSEAVKATLRGIRRTVGSAPARKAPATADKVIAMVAKADTDLKGFRDRALLLLGFAGAFRRSELVALNIADLEFCDGGLRVAIRKSKTDQEGLGTTIAIARGAVACPVDAVRIWVKASCDYGWAPIPACYKYRKDLSAPTIRKKRG